MSSKPRVTYFEMSFLPGIFGFTTDRAAFAKEVRKLGHKEPIDFLGSATAMATHHMIPDGDGSTVSIVTLDLDKTKGRSRAQIAALLTHEATHVWQTQRDLMGEEKPGREIEAYAIQFFTQCMLSELERKRP